jgi:dynein heavy chain
MKKMIVLRCFRTDRVIYAIRNYVEYFMKKEFIENRPTSVKDVFEESVAAEPIIFVLSPGVDPTAAIKICADARNILLEPLSMGRGQSEKAKQLLAAGA